MNSSKRSCYVFKYSMLFTIKHGGPLASAFESKKYYRKNREKQKFSIHSNIWVSKESTLSKWPAWQSGQMSQFSPVKERWPSVQVSLGFLSEELRISVCLYVDEVEICNPLGIKKYKLCAIYWILNNAPSLFQPIVSSIYFEVLCKTEWRCTDLRMSCDFFCMILQNFKSARSERPIFSCSAIQLEFSK